MIQIEPLQIDIEREEDGRFYILGYVSTSRREMRATGLVPVGVKKNHGDKPRGSLNRRMAARAQNQYWYPALWLLEEPE